MGITIVRDTRKPSKELTKIASIYFEKGISLYFLSTQDYFYESEKQICYKFNGENWMRQYSYFPPIIDNCLSNRKNRKVITEISKKNKIINPRLGFQEELLKIISSNYPLNVHFINNKNHEELFLNSTYEILYKKNDKRKIISLRTEQIDKEILVGMDMAWLMSYEGVLRVQFLKVGLEEWEAITNKRKMNIEQKSFFQELIKLLERNTKKEIFNISFEYKVNEYGLILITQIYIGRSILEHVQQVEKIVKYSNNFLYNDELSHFTSALFNQSGASNICTYALVLEAWRRGLRVEIEKRTKYSLFPEVSSEKKTLVFNRSRSELNSKEAVRLCIDKYKTKELLQKNNINTPNGFLVNLLNDDEEYILNRLNVMDYPLVIKPLEGSLGNGVFTNIGTEKEFKELLDYFKSETSIEKILVEEHFYGSDYRFYVLGDRVVAVVKRVPANITGDGKSTIEELIFLKNKERKKNPYLKKGLIKINKETNKTLTKLGLEKSNILPLGEVCYLKEIANASSGGDTIDVTDLISLEMKKVAIEAIKSIPDLYQGGVDILIKDNEYSVIEINSRPELGLHLYPSRGKARDIPREILNYYFPDTMDYQKLPKYFLEFSSIEAALSNKGVNKIKLKDYPARKKTEGLIYLFLKESYLKMKEEHSLFLKNNNIAIQVEEKTSLVILITNTNNKIAIDLFEKYSYETINNVYHNFLYQ